MNAIAKNVSQKNYRFKVLVASPIKVNFAIAFERLNKKHENL